ncbi:hypothetical protein SELMODRAFT_418714 [Selaginella moellendorffii]|uniref:Phospholipid/glycerol acyltransferase domain-containing protein n=1 Tax=Selaginella moellendorffii TaxID=88036 RepID=D8S6X5_SELML|nr:hypothetical protein SELMODRAFT_418714 [Selaginella moellendorffii]
MELRRKASWKVKPSFRRDASVLESTILLIFAEGTCVNKEDIVMFKQIVFELDFTVCPVSLKRNELKLRKSLEILRPISKLTEEEQLNVVPLENPVAYAFFLHGPETPLDHAKKITNKDKFME